MFSAFLPKLNNKRHNGLWLVLFPVILVVPGTEQSFNKYFLNGCMKDFDNIVEEALLMHEERLHYSLHTGGKTVCMKKVKLEP